MAKFPVPPDQSGFSYSKGSSSVLTQLDGGKPRIRRDQLGSWAKYDCQWTLTRESFETVMDFYETTLVEGTLPFTIELYMNKAMTLTEHNAVIVPETFKLSSQSGLTFVVTAQLMVSPKPVTP